MNPVTRSLLQKVPGAELHRFVERWDELEALIVEIFRQQSVSFAQQEAFFRLRSQLIESHKLFRVELDSFWPGTKVKGEAVREDPFLVLLRVKAAKEFVENWGAMKTLPAAREAVNQMLMARIEAGK